jgi:hypothetical protein
MIKKMLLTLLILGSYLYAEDGVDCLVNKSKNSITCKYTQSTIKEDRKITMDWVEPSGVVSRHKVLSIPANHISVYDYRYLNGRTTGEWTIKVTDKGQKFSSTFIVE